MSRYVGRESCEKWCGALGPQLVSLELGSGALSSVFDRAHGWFGKWGRASVRVRDRARGDQRTTRSNLGLENLNMANDEGRRSLGEVLCDRLNCLFVMVPSTGGPVGPAGQSGRAVELPSSM